MPTVRCFTPECKDNAVLNKYASNKRNKQEGTGGKRLWDSLRYLEAMLDGSPAFIVMEQLPNFRGTAPLERMQSTSAAAG